MRIASPGSRRASPLRSGWALGQQHLERAVAIVDVAMGKGHIAMFGPPIIFRAQAHGTFKFLFNGIYYGTRARRDAGAGRATQRVTRSACRAGGRIAAAPRLTILTGAGVSAASGVPTFRGADGLWRHYRPEDLATAAAFRRDPALVWEWYHWRRARIAPCEPNAAHRVIAEWSRRDGCRVITQNVDDLHLRAGTRDLVRLHGSIWESKCWQACGQPQWREEHAPRIRNAGPARHVSSLWRSGTARGRLVRRIARSV